MENNKNILVLCTGNSCRSQMMHGYIAHYAGDSWNVYSAGVEVHGLNPLAVHVMQEDGVDISAYTSNHIDEYISEVSFDTVLTVCDHANEHCPVIPGGHKKIHKSFNDPAQAVGNYKEILRAFRLCRDEIKAYVLATFTKV